ncbi:netrin unc-6 [Trichonephila clavipes]|nr:netrin unc-6 [Trichonephila clavipes]
MLLLARKTPTTLYDHQQTSTTMYSHAYLASDTLISPIHPVYKCGKCPASRKRLNLKKYCKRDYAIQADIISRETVGDWVRFGIHVRHVFKAGPIKLRTGPQSLWISQAEVSCSCPKLRLKHSYLILGGYQSPQVILTSSFLSRGRHLNSDDANLYKDLILPRASKPNRHSRDLLHTEYDMAAVDFLHHENPPTWARVEPVTLGTGGQRQTNHATQAGPLKYIKW